MLVFLLALWAHFYPQPLTPIPHSGAWSQAFLQANHTVSQLTTAEKVNLTSAFVGPCPSNSGSVPRLGIPGLCFDDGRRCSMLTLTIAAGPRYTDFITQWPSAFTAAASFDRDLIAERARRIGYEFRGKGINVALAPVGDHASVLMQVTGGPLGRS